MVFKWCDAFLFPEELAPLHPNRVSSLILYRLGLGGDKAIPSISKQIETLRGVSITPEEQAKQFLSN